MTKKAREMGLLDKPTKCRPCGQDKGIIQSHNKDYDVTLAYTQRLINGVATADEIAAIKDALVPICWRCHMIYHSKKKNMGAYRKYVKEIQAGKMWPPVYKHNYSILRENGF